MQKEPTVVNYRGIHRQLTTDAILIQIETAALSSIITLKISQNFSNLSKNLNQIYSTKSQISNDSVINIHSSCYNCFSFFIILVLYYTLHPPSTPTKSQIY